MTKQTLDKVKFQNDTFGLVLTDTGRFPFDPLDYGIEPAGWSTGDYRGFYSHYEVIHNELYLNRVGVGLRGEDHKAAERGKGPELFGIIPKRHYHFACVHYFDAFPLPCRVASTEFIYDEMNVLLPFSGGILIGKDVVSGYWLWPEIWCFRYVWELVFDHGNLVLSSERSREMASYREEFFKFQPSGRNGEWYTKHDVETLLASFRSKLTRPYTPIVLHRLLKDCERFE